LQGNFFYGSTINGADFQALEANLNSVAEGNVVQSNLIAGPALTTTPTATPATSLSTTTTAPVKPTGTTTGTMGKAKIKPKAKPIEPVNRNKVVDAPGQALSGASVATIQVEARHSGAASLIEQRIATSALEPSVSETAFLNNTDVDKVDTLITSDGEE
jgi:hypothetical protein